MTWNEFGIWRRNARQIYTPGLRKRSIAFTRVHNFLKIWKNFLKLYNKMPGRLAKTEIS